MTPKHRIGYNIYNPYLLCSCDTSIRYNEAGLTQHLLDAGRAAAKGEPVTAALVPQIKPGAQVRAEFDTTNGVKAYEGTVVEWDTYRNGDARLVVANVYLKSATRVYLLAEAPDPDAEARTALASVMGNGDPVSSDDLRSADDLLNSLRAKNFDVVRKDDAS